MRKQGIDSKLALEVVTREAFRTIKSKYGNNLEENIFIGFLVNEIKEYLTLNIKVSRYKEVEKLVQGALTALNKS